MKKTFNITYDEMNEVSQYIGACINKQYMYQEQKKKEQKEQKEKRNKNELLITFNIN